MRAISDGCPSAEARITMMKKNITPHAVPPTDSEPDDNDDDVRDPDYVPPSQHGLSVKLTCERLHCSDEIFAACQSCLMVSAMNTSQRLTHYVPVGILHYQKQPIQTVQPRSTRLKEKLGNRSAARWMNQSRRNQGVR